jgi:hypothetical protein
MFAGQGTGVVNLRRRCAFILQLGGLNGVKKEAIRDFGRAARGGYKGNPG